MKIFLLFCLLTGNLFSQATQIPASGGGGGSGTVTNTGTLTADKPVIGNGTTDIKVAASSGNTTTFATTSGVFTPGNAVTVDASGNFIDAGSPVSGGITQLTGDATAGPGSGSVAVTVTKINGTSLAGLATGILKNTTTTGVPSIAVAGDFPTLNQNTTGSAATLTTPRAIYGNNFDGSAALTQVIASTYGGTGNGFTKFSGPTTSEKTFTLPDASATILTTNAAVTVPQGGTGLQTLTIHSIQVGNATSNVTQLTVGTNDQVLMGSTSADPVWASLTNCGDSTHAVSYNTTTHAWGCQAITATASAAGSTNDIQWNNASALAGGRCTMDSSSAITCSGGFASGDGTVAGIEKFYELAANGSNFRAITAPDALTQDLTLVLPDDNPTAGQVIGWGSPIASVSTGSWRDAAGVGTCTNQVVTATSNNAAPTCTTITSAYVNSSIAVTGASNSWASGVKQTFTPSATTSGLNVGSLAGNPSSPADGDIWYNSSTQSFTVRTSGSITTSLALTGGDIDTGSNVVSTHFGTANQTFWSGTGATQTLTFQVTNVDPVLTFSDGVMNLSTGALQVGGAAVLVSGGALGTPSSGTLTNATGLPIGGITGLGTGVGTWLGTPSSANLASAITDETGSGALVFGTSPSLTTPTLGVATATSINKVAITAPATSATLTIADGKTLTASNTLTFTGTDSSSVAFGAGGTVMYTSTPTTLATGTSVSLTAPRQYYVCTSTCTVTPPVPAAGYEFCVFNTNNDTSAITLAALGSSAMYQNTAHTAYGTAGTGTLVSTAGTWSHVCILGLDSTHYITAGYTGTWTAN